MRQNLRRRVHVLVAVLVAEVACSVVNGAVTVIGVQYQPDNAYPEYNCIWHDKNYPASCSGTIVGANVHVYLRNDGASPATVSDVTLAGYSLATVIKRNTSYHESNSIYYYWDTPPQAIIDAGEPVWFKADPSTIPAGGTAQAVIRLRFVPTTPTVSVGVVTSAGTVNATIPVDGTAAQLANVGFSSDRTKVYLHWRRSGGAAPVTIKMDGVDVTASTTTVGDASVNFAESVITLGTPLPFMSYHVFQGIYADSKTATASLRAWSHPFIHASWSVFTCADGDTACGQQFVDDSLNRGLNAVQNQIGGGVGDFLASNAGKAYAAAHGYGTIVWNTYTSENPLLSFLDDEPDAEEDNVSKNFCGTGLKLNCGASPMGILAMRFIESGETYRSLFPNSPTTINMNGTFKPENYYSYGQAVDVLQVDPYYQKRLKDTYWYHNPEWIPLYNKATYNYAVAQAVTSAAEPNPSHIILLSTESRETVNGVQKTWPFPTPQSKRIEVYYSLAGGAKGISYWWFKPGYPSNGLGAQTPAALALWKEMGLYGNEIKTISPILVTSHPVAMTLTPSANVWARALASGTDTIILLVVNDNYYNDEAGFHSTPVNNATVTATLPSWMQSPAPTAFEVSPSGLSDVTTQLNGSQLQLNLGTLNITRMIVITTDPQLRTTTQQRYDQEVRPGICAFAPEYCTNSPPTITQQPQSTTACAGSSATFNVTGAGTGTISYQWQKNLANLSNGGHYSGVTTSTLTISTASAADVASYRCVVSNTFGDTNSNAASLTVITCVPGCLQSLGFEGGFTSGTGNGWTKFIKAGSEGPNLIFSDETTEHHSGSHSQEVYSHDIGYDGGVYQRLAATPGQPYTVKAWIKVFSPQGTGIAEGFFGIDPTGDTNPNSANVLWASKPWDYWSQDTWNVTAQGNYVTVYLRGRSTKGASTNKVAYVWMDDVEVSPGSPTDATPQPLSPTSIRWKWIDLSIETGYRVRDAATVDKSGLLASDMTQWTETTGISPNTQYTRRICAINDCGESDPSVGQTTYSLIETPTDVTFGSITTTSIVASPVGTLSNLTTANSGVRVSNTTAGTNSGWQTTLNSWTSSGLTANTPYDFVARARNANSAETPDSIPETAWTLSLPPAAGSVTSDGLSICVNGTVTWSAAGGFGAGKVQYYRFAWDQSATHNWTDAEPQWSEGTIATSPTSTGTWYLHVKGYNGADVANGTYDYALTTGQTVAADHDGDCDVDATDFDLLKACLSRSQTPPSGGCGWADLDQDGDADLSDFGAFQRCFSGENTPVDLNCVN